MGDRMKIIIDTDPGIDDAMAIFYAHAAPDIDLLALTTVFGNVFVEQATRNASYLTKMLGIDIPVVQGASGPLDGRGFKPSKHVHGEEGFGNFTDIPDQVARLDVTASEYLVRMAREYKGELVICAIASLTNIAKAIQLDPEFIKNVCKIVVMGGAVDCPGNITEHAEANVFHDPVAAEVVFTSGAPIVLVGLDVTLKTLCSMDDLERMAEMAPITGGFLKTICESYVKFYREVEGEDGCGLHDSTALIACTNPDLFTMEDIAIDTVLSGEEVGRTCRSMIPDKPRISVCLSIDANAVGQQFLNRICRNP
jgi:inosine-uridine nucleoside N-ribohydrolase